MLRGPGTLGRAAAARASQELTLMLPERQRRKLAATAATGGSMPVMSALEGRGGLGWARAVSLGELFPSGPSTDCALTLFLVMLRTLDVLTERFGVEATSRWLQAMLAIVEKASADFRLRLLMLRIFIHRADALEPVLLGRHVEAMESPWGEVEWWMVVK
eukprot:Skav201874  [mRNA]  locus=scaffold550:21028:26003:- [translate_table: standard]